MCNGVPHGKILSLMVVSEDVKESICKEEEISFNFPED